MHAFSCIFGWSQLAIAFAAIAGGTLMPFGSDYLVAGANTGITPGTGSSVSGSRIRVSSRTFVL